MSVKSIGSIFALSIRVLYVAHLNRGTLIFRMNAPLARVHRAHQRRIARVFMCTLVWRVFGILITPEKKKRKKKLQKPTIAQRDYLHSAVTSLRI